MSSIDISILYFQSNWASLFQRVQLPEEKEEAQTIYIDLLSFLSARTSLLTRSFPRCLVMDNCIRRNISRTSSNESIFILYLGTS